MLLVALAVLAGATLQSALGFGGALVMSPALLAVLEPQEAVTVLVLLGSGMNLVIAAAERRRWHVRWRLLTVLLLGALPGLLAGVAVLRVASRPALQVVVGVVVLLAVATSGRSRAAPADGAPRAGARTAGRTSPEPRAATAAVGVVVGALTTTTGTNGPPMVLLLARLGLPPAQLRDTLFAAFTGLGVLAVPVLVVGGGWDAGGVPPLGLLGLAALTAVGRALGWRVFRVLPERAFRLAGLSLVALLGVVSLVAGLGGLLDPAP